MTSVVLSKIPALRILLPFVLGIILATEFPAWWTMWLFLCLGIVIFMFLSWQARQPLLRYRLRHWWYASFFVLSLAVGMLSVLLWIPREIDLNGAKDRQMTALIERIDAYDFSMRIQASVQAIDSAPTMPSRILLTTRGCNYLLREGDLVAFNANLSPIVNLGNPDEFDRQNHLWQQGIRYGQHLTSDKLLVIGHRNTLTSLAASCRRWLTKKVLQTSLSPESQRLMIALLLGDSRAIEAGVRSQYSQAGIAHILALSGLHVGLICSLIWFLLFPLDYLRLKKLRLLATLLVLVAFCFLTGLSPSAIRATIMIGFTLVAVVLYRKSISLNAMCVAAILTLTIWPMAIYQAGFQLSYVTVATLLIFQGQVYRYFNPKWPLLRGVWSLVAMSALAMLATVMLSAYYFNSFSLLSVVSNLLILPVMPLLMVLGALFLFFAAIGLDWNVLNLLIDGLYQYMNWVTRAVSAIPLSHVSGVYVNGLSVWLFYGILACLSLWLLCRRARWLVGALAVTLLFVLQLAIQVWVTPDSRAIVLNNYVSTPILWHDGRYGYVWIADYSQPDTAQFEQIHRRLLAHSRIDTLQWVSGELHTSHSMANPPFAYIHGTRLLVAGSGLKHSVLENMAIVPVDVIVVTKRYRGKLKELTDYFPCRQVVLSGALSDDRQRKLQDECNQLAIECHIAPYELSK